MKKLVQVEEVQGEGLIKLLGEEVMLLCLNYIYAGKLVGVNDSFIQLENAHIVYETGAFTDRFYKDAQKLNSEVFYVMNSSIEGFGKGKALK
jgi:hypothetical protein